MSIPTVYACTRLAMRILEWPPLDVEQHMCRRYNPPPGILARAPPAACLPGMHHRRHLQRRLCPPRQLFQLCNVHCLCSVRLRMLPLLHKSRRPFCYTSEEQRQPAVLRAHCLRHLRMYHLQHHTTSNHGCHDGHRHGSRAESSQFMSPRGQTWNVTPSKTIGQCTGLAV